MNRHHMRIMATVVLGISTTTLFAASPEPPEQKPDVLPVVVHNAAPSTGAVARVAITIHRLRPPNVRTPTEPQPSRRWENLLQDARPRMPDVGVVHTMPYGPVDGNDDGDDSSDEDWLTTTTDDEVLNTAFTEDWGWIARDVFEARQREVAMETEEEPRNIGNWLTQGRDELLTGDTVDHRRADEGYTIERDLFGERQKREISPEQEAALSWDGLLDDD